MLPLMSNQSKSSSITWNMNQCGSSKFN